MPFIHYFAYGSNLHPLRLVQRIPSAQLVGTGKLHGYQLTFHKRGQDDSGKGHIYASQHRGHFVWGAVYQLAREHKSDLDVIEGRGYESNWFDVKVGNILHHCFAYIGLPDHLDDAALPYHWYKSLIVLGAEFHEFPSRYIHEIRQTPSVEDPDTCRRGKHEQLIADMLKFQYQT